MKWRWFAGEKWQHWWVRSCRHPRWKSASCGKSRWWCWLERGLAEGLSRQLVDKFQPSEGPAAVWYTDEELTEYGIFFHFFIGRSLTHWFMKQTDRLQEKEEWRTLANIHDSRNGEKSKPMKWKLFLPLCCWRVLTFVLQVTTNFTGPPSGHWRHLAQDL